MKKALLPTILFVLFGMGWGDTLTVDQADGKANAPDSLLIEMRKRLLLPPVYTFLGRNSQIITGEMLDAMRSHSPEALRWVKKESRYTNLWVASLAVFAACFAIDEVTKTSNDTFKVVGGASIIIGFPTFAYLSYRCRNAAIQRYNDDVHKRPSD